MMPPDKKINRFIVPGWLPSWMYTHIEMGADLESMKIELADIKRQLDETLADNERLRDWCVSIAPLLTDEGGER